MKKNIFFILAAVLSLSVSTCKDTDNQTDIESVTVSPATASVAHGGGETFTATVKGKNDPAQTVTWTVSGGVTGTTISTAGTLTVAVSESANELTVKATSTVDTDKYGTAKVTVTAATATVTSVTVSPASAIVNPGGKRHFYANVTGANNPAQTVTWELTGGKTGTNIDQSGNLSVAADEAAGTNLTVKAISKVDTSQSGTAAVTVGDKVEPTDNRILNPATTNTQLSNSSWSPITSNHGGGNKWLVQADRLGYETWDEDTQGTASFRWYGQNQGGGAAFRAEWGVESDPAKRPLDFLARVGYFWNENKAHAAYGDIYCGFNFERSGRYRGNFSYIGIYGWSKNPLVEYYVVEDTYGNAWRDETGYIQNIQETILSDIAAADRDKPEYYKGTYTLDGGTYKVYRKSRTGPSIEGSNSSFTQFFSVRQTPRKSGTISVTEHFKKWEELGMNLGNNMYECKFKVEVGGRPDGNGGAYSGWFDARLIQFYRANDDGSIIQITQ